MNETETTVTTPFPMEGFEGADPYTVSVYTRIGRIGELLKAKKKHHYIPGMMVGSSLALAAGPYLHKVPQEDTMEFFILTHHGAARTPLPDPALTQEHATVYLDAFYDLYLSLSLAALKAEFAGDATRPIDLSMGSSRRRMKKSESWILQRRGRVSRLGSLFDSDIIVSCSHVKGASRLPEIVATTDETHWEKWFGKLEECKKLKEGWDGYRAKPPTAVAIENSRVFLTAMRDAGCEPTRVAASAMGGIAITRKAGDRIAFIECYNDGRVYWMFSDRASGDMDVKPLSMDQETLRTFLASMREFLNG